MTKLVLTNPTTFVADASAVAQATTNNAAIVAALENTLSRDGTSPNTMSASLDMNSQRILNLPEPLTANEPARLTDVGQAPVSAAAAAASAAAALVSETAVAADLVLTNADVVATAASAAAAAASVAGLSGTSTTSKLIATGSQTFTTQAGKLFAVGAFVTLASAADTANYFHGAVTSYSGTTLIVNVLDVGGAGTYADWEISISGTQGSQGIQGIQGDPGTGTISGGVIHGVGIATGAAAMSSTAAMTDGQMLVGQTGADPLPKTLTGDVTITAAGATAIKASVSLTTPNINVATATSVNKMAITAPATSSTLAVADGKTATISNTLTVTGTDGSTLAVGPGGTLTGSSAAAIFYDQIPLNSQSAAYTLVLADAQKCIYHPSADTTARIWTIPANGSVAYPIGTCVMFDNDISAGAITISITTDTLVLVGSAGSTGSRTLASGGQAVAVKVTATRWRISGVGLT